MKGKWYLTFIHWGTTGFMAMTETIELAANNEEGAIKEATEKYAEAKLTHRHKEDLCYPKVQYIISLGDK